MNVTGIILSARPWEMEDEVTKEVRRGVSVQYVLNPNLDPVDNEDGVKGILVGKSSMPLKEFKSLTVVPGVYDMHFDITIKGGKPGLKLSMAIPLGEVGKIGCKSK